MENKEEKVTETEKDERRSAREGAVGDLCALAMACLSHPPLSPEEPSQPSSFHTLLRWLGAA